MQIKSVDTLLNNILTLHCPTVARLYTNKKPATYIIYYFNDVSEKNYADDDAQGTSFYYHIDIYSKKDYLSLVEDIIKDLKKNGFEGIKITGESYESETGYYHISLEINYFKYESEEE